MENLTYTEQYHKFQVLPMFKMETIYAVIVTPF